MLSNPLIALAGLSIGAVVGAVAFRSNFCALGSVADILFAKDWRRMRAWTLAAGVAIFGTQALDSAGGVDVDSVLAPYLLWLPALVGGTAFGFGMSLAGGCLNRALVRVGAGSVKSLAIILVAWIAAAITLLTPLPAGLAFVGSIDLMTIAPEGLHRIIAAVTAFDAALVQWATTILVGGGLIVFSVKDAWFRSSREHLVAGLAIGAMIPLAWLASGSTVALNYAVPIDGFLPKSGSALPHFTIASILGVPLGAFAVALPSRNVALELFAERSEIPRNLVGAALMGFGGALALGCTFGQGLSGLSTLSVAAMVTIAGIIFGCLWGIRYFEAGGLWSGLKLTLSRAV